jgi:hypothetical protein
LLAGSSDNEHYHVYVDGKIAEEMMADDKKADKTDDATGGQELETDGQEGGKDEKPPEKQFSQADVDNIIADRLRREKEKSEKASQKAKETAEAEALAEQDKFKELAEKHGLKITGLEADLETRVAELEDTTGKIDRLEVALQALLEAQKEGLPDFILPLLEKMDPVDQLEYLAKNRESLIKSDEDGKGVPPSPKPKGDPEKLSDDDRRKQAVSARSYY